MSARHAIEQYADVAVDARVEAASPHRLIQMLYDAALKNIAAAKYAEGKRNLEAKSRAISKTTAIIMELRQSLDMSSGGEIAQNLSELYSYMLQRLMVANTSEGEGVLDEMSGLIKPLQEAWAAISTSK